MSAADIAGVFSGHGQARVGWVNGVDFPIPSSSSMNTMDEEQLRAYANLSYYRHLKAQIAGVAVSAEDKVARKSFRPRPSRRSSRHS